MRGLHLQVWLGVADLPNAMPFAVLYGLQGLARGLPLTIIREAGTKETQRYQARWVLVRPDHFVAWVAHDAVLSAAVAEEVLAVVSGAND